MMRRKKLLGSSLLGLLEVVELLSERLYGLHEVLELVVDSQGKGAVGVFLWDEGLFSAGSSVLSEDVPLNQRRRPSVLTCCTACSIKAS